MSNVLYNISITYHVLLQIQYTIYANDTVLRFQTILAIAVISGTCITTIGFG